ncbi:hypothetical protein MGYG_01761 [Nannizzia gypsea CBS 118893]|uniref:Uncharacterized protein n=1 Tax=Arthroderma gypseum (strain ATCC MYA-4604 / CBS 118893) TaxID=535722 RepID=E5R339_ARTGP|nr:hypothetical protein MGYG_01761 [Nannizzia gypsea CBS 118893]EFQ98743.1 hypothetical protein MGYG_01761 [Nannizzia gypsea CBS 118893]
MSSSVQISHANSSMYFGEEISLEHLLRRDVWASWASNSTLRINISVRIQTSLTRNFSLPDTMQKILELLTLPSVWSCYGLIATKNGVLQNGTNTLDIILHAKPTRNQATGCGLNKFPKSLCALLDGNLYVQPPPEIPTVHIHEVDILLEFSNDPSPSNLLPENNDDHNAPIDVLLSDSDGWESLDDSSPFSSQGSISTCNSEHLNYESSMHKSMTSKCLNIGHIRSIISLLDAGFSTLLNIPSSNTRSLSSVSSNEPQVSLAELSPCIFSPGYNMAMFQRLAFIPLIIKGMSSMIKTLHSDTCESAASKIHEIYRCKSQIAEPDIQNMLRYILWIQTQNSLYSTNERPKARHHFATAIPNQQGMLRLPMITKQKTDSIDTLFGTSICPDSDWYIFEDDEEDDILLSDEAYCEEQEEWYNPPTLPKSIANMGDSWSKTTPIVTDQMIDSDGILSSSPCLLAEVEMDSIPDQCLADEPGSRTKVAVDLGAETDTEMEMLQSSSPMILPLSANEESPYNVETDRSAELYTFPSLESSDIEMMLL